MTGMLVALGLGVAIALVVVPWYLQHKRREGMAAVAARHGLHHSASDPFGCVRIAFPLFRRGDGQGAEQVVWRDRPDGLTTRAFDYWYYDEREDNMGRAVRSYRRFSCVLAQVDGSWPEVSITKDGFVEKALDLVGLGSIELESDEFNRRFALRSSDRRFAVTLCDARMIEFLLTTEAQFAFAVKGRWVLLASDPVAPDLVPALMRVAESFVERIPRVVYELWPSPFRDADGRPLPAGDEGLGYAVAQAEADEQEPWRAPRRYEDRAPGPEYDLDGNIVEAVPENPWGEQPKPPAF
jgi:hypothetical protein